ncbi:hypothetical protein G3I40_03725 [Streptomyces sp. SID14478]|nr:hypothetical protein [Streptomyces sp. SID14478]NEB74346.1 hypothetical protein [Streptomyces sp. SID14478]
MAAPKVWGGDGVRESPAQAQELIESVGDTEVLVDAAVRAAGSSARTS